MPETGKIRRWIALAVFVVSVSAAPPDAPAGSARIDWNDREVTWYGYNEGTAMAKQAGKPSLIVFYADWCPTCKRFGETFRDRRIVRAASGFIMIRVNIDQRKTLSSAFGFDGEYVPRTFAVYPDGRVMHQLYPEKKFRYYVGTDPSALLALMEKAGSLP